ncbi:MAG: hypothetical protein JWN99_3362 [Ilumatobacteraceae bacterium]|nr:hypothetical protein [Ilumatobacteraceae bacterium]
MSRSLIARLGIVLGLVVGVVVPVVAARSVGHAAVAGTSSYVPVGPVRLVDTRENKGFTRSGDTTLQVPVANIGGVPKNATAVTLSVAVTGAQLDGYVTVWPSDQKMPLSSNVNFEAGQIVSNGLIVKLGATGALTIFSSVAVDVVVDVTGAFVPATSAKAGRFVAVDPVRVLDSRGGAPMPAGGLVRVALPATAPRDAIAAAVTLTTSGENEPGFFTAFGAGAVPWSSSLNVDTPDSTRAATVVIPVTGGGMSVFSSNGGHLIVDFLGYFTGASAASSEDGLFVPMTPTRLLDTRSGGALGVGESLLLPATGGVVVGNIAMTDAARPGYATVYAAGTPLPATSSVNAMRTGQTVSNMAISRTSSAGMAIFSQQGSDFVFDQTGYFTGAQVPQTVSLPCGVSAILVPGCGAWLGASTAPKSGALDGAGYTKGLAEYEAVAGNTPDILHFYKTGAMTFPTSQEIAMATRPGVQRSLLSYNWKPSTSMSWADIAAGGADSAIDTVAAGLKKYPHKVFLTIWHEPENDLNSNGRTEADYVAMYRHVVTALRADGVTNAVFVMNYMGFSGWAKNVDAMYPGDDVVDWIAYDPYGFAAQKDFGVLLNTTASGWPGFYSWATRKAPGKPLMLGEWGIDLRVQPNAASILDGAAAIMASQYPMVKALVYWNDDNGGFAVRLDQTSALGQAYGAAYARMASQPYFNSTATAAAP